jgi:hypothetical protein
LGFWLFDVGGFGRENELKGGLLKWEKELLKENW